MKNQFSLQGLKSLYLRRYEPENFVRLAITYWTVVLLCTGVLIVAVIAFGAWQFLSPPSPLVTEYATQNSSGFNRAQLKHVVDAFEKRRRDFTEMMSAH